MSGCGSFLQSTPSPLGKRGAGLCWYHHCFTKQMQMQRLTSAEKSPAAPEDDACHTPPTLFRNSSCGFDACPSGTVSSRRFGSVAAFNVDFTSGAQPPSFCAIYFNDIWALLCPATSHSSPATTFVELSTCGIEAPCDGKRRHALHVILLGLASLLNVQQ